MGSFIETALFLPVNHNSNKLRSDVLFLANGKKERLIASYNSK